VGEFRVPASRPSWKGYIKLALVSCPIALWPATSPSERIAFRQVNKKTGNRIRYQSVDEGTREPVETQDKGKGYEVEKDHFIMVEEEELKSIQIESSKTIEIDSFVPRSEIDERFLDAPYYVAPSDKVGAEAFAVIREAMRGKDMVALGRVVLSSREHVVMLQPWDKGMLAVLLRYPYELRAPEDYFHDIPNVKIDPELLGLAEHILRNKQAAFDPSRFVDRYEQAVVELLETKRKGMPNIVHSVATPKFAIDLMDALKRSLEKSLPAANDAKTVAKPAAKATKAKKPKSPDPLQREMLLPIAGKKAPSEASKSPEAAKPQGKATARRKAG
jgi:DNA end-binding protein Ku